MPYLLSLPTELLSPILQHALIPLPTSLPTIRALSLTHPRLYTLVLHLLKQTLASYEAVGTNQLLPHPYSRKDDKGEVVYQDFAGMKAGMERIVEWRWVRARLPTVTAKMEKAIPQHGFCWEQHGGIIETFESVEEDEEVDVLDGLGSGMVGLNLETHLEEQTERAEDREARARAKLTAWLLGKK